MSWVSIANMALFGVLITLAVAATATLAGLDRWLDDRRNRRSKERFYSGSWLDVWDD